MANMYLPEGPERPKTVELDSFWKTACEQEPGLLDGPGYQVRWIGLDRDSTDRALAAIRRFVKLGQQLGVQETHVLATAATREASNGEEFVADVEAITGSTIELLSGRQEAEFAAQGIKSGFFKPNGIAGDLGGVFDGYGPILR